MEIRIPSGLSQSRLYSIAEEVIREYQLDSVNLNEFPIRVFNKIAYSLNIPVDESLTDKFNNVFVSKGSYQSVIELLRILGIEATVSVDKTASLKINIDLSTVSDTSFIQYLSESVSYLIFYESIKINIENILREINLTGIHDISAVGLNVSFSEI